jgi:hypothetical protein
MLFAFVDETSDAKFKDYLGLCIATVNDKFYAKIKSQAQDILFKANWNPEIEFKGSYLLSAKQGCPTVLVEKRIEIAHKLLDLHLAKSNQRMHFHYGRMQSAKHKEDYLKSLPGLLKHALPSPQSGPGKNLVCVICDKRDDITNDEIHEALSPVVASRKYILFERVAVAKSTFDTIGLMYADIVGYIMGRIDTISNDVDLFDGLTPQQLDENGKIKKLRSSEELIRKIKKLNLYKHKS